MKVSTNSSARKSQQTMLSRLSRSKWLAGLIAITASLVSAAAAGTQAPPIAHASPAHVGAANTNLVILGPSVSIRPTRRVVSPIDNNHRTTINGQTLAFLHNASDLGALAGDTAMNHLLMVLQASPEQDHALKALVDQQLDQAHPNFHRWLTPDQFGTYLGVADADIAQVTGWLEDQGFNVEQVAPGKRFIQFSGTVDQVESAFQTEMHRYQMNGSSETHVANSADISVPTALRPVIAGVATLHDFFKTSNMKGARSISTPVDAWLGTVRQADLYAGVFSSPDYTNGTTHFVGAADFAAIYNTTPLIQGGFDGTGVSIGIIGRTDIHLEDVQLYRQMFGLKNNDPTFVVGGEDPGVVGGDDGESYLDVEVSGGAAPGAAVKFVTSRATLTTDGVDLAAMYAVQNNLTDIISESYGQCEANFTAVQAAFYNDLWGQAATQGQSVFVSSGDNGPAACDSSNNTFSNFGYAVSLLASSPYNVAVGGTLFADTPAATYWGAAATTSAPFGSALGYIPEIPWNEAKGSGATGAGGLWSGSGGISAYFATPSWQRGFGVPLTDPAYPNGFKSDPAAPFVAGPHRYLPDVSMAAAAQHDGTLYCAEGICQLSSTGALVNAGIVGGTSVAAPTMAGVQALIDHRNGGRQGMPNYIYYALADAQHTAGLNCSAEAGVATSSTCAFHDVDTGNILVCGNSACTAATKLGWTAAAGYDLASGLGSPNVTNLANLWSSVTFNSTSTSLNLSQTTGIVHGQAVTASGSVAASSGPIVPTGQVAFLASSGALTDPTDPNTGGFQNPVSLATLDGSGNYSISLGNLPAGTYYLTARYGGDGTFASSLSAPVQVTVSSESSAVTIIPNAFNGTTCVETPATTFTYGSYVWTDFVVTGSSAQGVPTGSIAISDNGNPLTTATLNPNGAAHMLSGAIATTSCVFGYTFQDTAPLTVGTHVLGAAYSGDSSFNAMTATPVTVTITQATLTGALATSASNIASADPVQLTLTIAGLSGTDPATLAPTGTVTFTDTTTAATLGTASLTPTTTFGARAIFSTNAITASGANSIVASWPGDNNYTAITSAAVTVTVQAGTATSVAVTSNTNPAALGGRPTFTATMTPTTVASGTVNFFDGGVLLGTGTVGAAHTATFRPAAAANLPVGTHNITASYAGNATFNASTSPALAQVFNKATTTIQLTAKTNGTFGEIFTMSGALGTVIAATPPSGTITFFDGANPIGSAPFTVVTAAQGGLNIFQAQLGSILATGTHTITAQLTDPNYTAVTSNAQTVNVVAPAAPSLSKTFATGIMAVGSSTALTFTVHNGNPTVGLSGITFTDPLPAGLVVSTPNGLTAGCQTVTGSVTSAGTVAATAAGNSISLNGLALAANGSCTFSVNVTGTAGGVQNNVTGNISATESGNGGTATASLTLVAPPVIAKAFSPASVTPNSTTSLTFTLTNPASNSLAETNVAFVDPLPAGLTVADSSKSVCGGTLTTTSATGAIALTGARVEVNSQCQFSVTVTATSSGQITNITNPVSSDNGGTGNSATAILNSGSSNLTVTIDDSHSYARGGQVLNYLVKISNAGPIDATGIGITETLSPALDAANATWVCVGGDAGASCTASGSGALSDSNVVIPASRSLSWFVTVPVLADTIEATADNSVDVTTSADPNAPYHKTDSDIVVIFRDGFDSSHGDGTGTQSITNASLNVLSQSFSTGQTLQLTIPSNLGQAPIDTLLQARAADGTGFRVERMNLAKVPFVRLVCIDTQGTEQAGVWEQADFSEQVTLALAGTHGTAAAIQTSAGGSTHVLSSQAHESYQIAVAVAASDVVIH